MVFIVRAPGKAAWSFRYQLKGRRREMGLGPHPFVTLSDAREKALAHLKLIAHGRDPLVERAATENKPGATFDEVSAKFIANKQAGWKAKADLAWRNTLATYASPKIGATDVREITREDIRTILLPIWSKKTPTAVKLRRRIEAVLNFAKAEGLREGDNPAAWKGNLEVGMPSPSSVHDVVHHAAVAYEALPKVFEALGKAQGVAAMAVRFVALTACRASEAIGATWDEIDLAKAVWSIPKERTKMGKAHHIPLSKPALAVLKEAAAIRRSALVFPGYVRNRPLSLAALVRALRQAGGGGATTHGLRTSFRTWCADNGVSREIAEMALAHAIGSAVEQSYQRSKLLELRRNVMAGWAAYLCKAKKARTERGAD